MAPTQGMAHSAAENQPCSTHDRWPDGALGLGGGVGQPEGAGPGGPMSSRRWAVTAVAAACALMAGACGRSTGTVGSSGSDNTSPTRGLVATTPAGTKMVPSVVWAVYRDVNS